MQKGTDYFAGNRPEKPLEELSLAELWEKVDGLQMMKPAKKAILRGIAKMSMSRQFDALCKIIRGYELEKKDEKQDLPQADPHVVGGHVLSTHENTKTLMGPPGDTVIISE